MNTPIHEARATLERAANSLRDVRSSIRGADVLQSHVAVAADSIKGVARDLMNLAVELQNAQRREAFAGRASLGS